MYFFGIRSASHPAQAEKTMNGNEKSTVAMLWMELIWAAAARRMAACL